MTLIWERESDFQSADILDGLCKHKVLRNVSSTL